MKAFFFDLDGTLIDSAPDLLAIAKDIAQEHRVIPPDDEQLRPCISTGSASILAKIFQRAPTDPRIIELCNQFFATYKNIDHSNTQLFDGIEQVLDSLNQHDVIWGVVTNKPQLYTESIITKIQPLQASAIIVCPEQLNAIKPNPEGLLLATKNTNVNPKDCWYLGDSQADMQAAKSAGMKAIIAGWGYIAQNENIDNWQADLYLPTTQALATLVQKDLTGSTE